MYLGFIERWRALFNNKTFITTTQNLCFCNATITYVQSHSQLLVIDIAEPCFSDCQIAECPVEQQRN